jgi:hypothetical protein
VFLLILALPLVSRNLRFRSYIPSVDHDGGEEVHLTAVVSDRYTNPGAFSTFTIVQTQNRQAQMQLTAAASIEPQQATARHAQSSSRQVDGDTMLYERTLQRFEQQYDRSFPSVPCAHCGVLLLPRSCQWQPFNELETYALTSVLDIQPHTVYKHGVRKVTVCSECKASPKLPIDAGPWPELLLHLPQRSRVYLSPLTLQTSLGRTTRPHGRNMSHWANYRTVTGMCHCILDAACSV